MTCEVATPAAASLFLLDVGPACEHKLSLGIPLTTAVKGDPVPVVGGCTARRYLTESAGSNID